MSFDEILKILRQRQADAAYKARPLWFRGQCNQWPLRSRIHRRYFSLGQYHLPPDVNQMRMDEKALFLHFRSLASTLLSEQQTRDWSLLLSMQHYDVPTRFLDWTESFLCALYFALAGAGRGDRPVVWVLRPEELNRRSVGIGEFIYVGEFDTHGGGLAFDPWAYHPCCLNRPEACLSTIAVKTNLINPRMVSQRSAFTLAGDSFEPLETEFGNSLAKDGILEVFEFDEAAVSDARDFLYFLGVSDFSFFPDLVGVAKQVKSDEARLRELTNRLIEAEGEAPPD